MTMATRFLFPSRLGYGVLAGFILAGIMSCSRPGTSLEGTKSGLHDLRGAACRLGDVVRSTSVFKLSNGRLLFATERQRLTGSGDVRFERIEESEVLALNGNEVTKCKQALILDKQENSFDFSGSTPFDFGAKRTSTVERNVLEGQAILYESQSGGWRKTLVGKPPSFEQQKSLQVLDLWEFDGTIYPKESVPLGHSWTVDGARLTRLLGPNFEIASGNATLTFEKMAEYEGEPCAQIAVKLQAKGSARDANKGELLIEVEATGQLYRSLAKGIDLKTNLQGLVKATEITGVDLSKSSMQFAGPFTMDVTTNRKGPASS